jgi:hypothetical protein
MWTPRWHILFLAAAVAPLSTPADVLKGDMPKGIFHGAMVSFEGSVNAGLLLARNSVGDVYACGYDANTYFEDDHHKTSVAKLEPGDPLEILTDHKPGTRVCYVRLVQVVPPPPPRSPRREVAAPAQPVTAPLKGDRTVSGMVIRLDRGTVTLRTRSGEETLLLRADTLYQRDGLRLDASSLAVNDRVSVRTGRNGDGQAVAYQVIWGELIDVP